MKILVAIPCILRGGTEIQTLSLVEALHSSGHQVIVFCYFEYERSVIDDFESSGAEVVLLGWKRSINAMSFVRNLRVEIHRIKPDVVHVQYMAPGALPIIAARLACIKKVFATVHQPYTTSHGLIAKLTLRTSSLLCTKFITVSVNAEKSWFGCGRLFDENKPVAFQPSHFTIYNSIDTVRIKKITTSVNIGLLKQELSIPANVIVIGAVSRLRFEKGIDLLINAFTLLLNSDVKTHLLLVGTGSEEVKLKQQVQDFGIRSNVTFSGETNWVTAIQLMTVMDIVVVPSRFEGFGLTAAEAMSAGKPVIASNVGGLSEIVDHEESGLLFEPEDPVEIALNILKIAKDLSVADRFGTNGKEKVLKTYSFEIFRKKISSLYSTSE